MEQIKEYWAFVMAGVSLIGSAAVALFKVNTLQKRSENHDLRIAKIERDMSKGEAKFDEVFRRLDKLDDSLSEQRELLHEIKGAIQNG